MNQHLIGVNEHIQIHMCVNVCVWVCGVCVGGGGQISELYFFNSIYIAKQLLYLILALHHRLHMHVVYLSCQPSWEVICHFHNPMLYGNNYDTFHILSARDLYNCENVINRSENTHTHTHFELWNHTVYFLKNRHRFGGKWINGSTPTDFCSSLININVFISFYIFMSRTYCHAMKASVALI